MFECPLFWLDESVVLWPESAGSSRLVFWCCCVVWTEGDVDVVDVVSVDALAAYDSVADTLPVVRGLNADAILL